MLSFYLRNKTKIQKGNEIIFGKKNRIRHCTITIRGLGNQLIFEDGANLRGTHLEIDGTNCTIQIGKNTVIGEGCYLSARENNTALKIGENCMLSRNVKIMTSDGHDIVDAQTKEKLNSAKSISIGQRVWLADSVVILKGCHIGDHVVVAINSVVTKNIPEKTIAAGNPAKIIRENSSWNTELTFSN